MMNTLTYFGNRKVVVQFVKELLRLSPEDSLSITITKLGKSGDYSVSIAIDTSLDDTVEKMAQTYSRLRSSISPEGILDG